MSVEDIVSCAGHWHDKIAIEIDKEALGQPYDRKMVKGILNHMKNHYHPQVYNHYKHITEVLDGL